MQNSHFPKIKNNFNILRLYRSIRNDTNAKNNERSTNKQKKNNDMDIRFSINNLFFQIFSLAHPFSVIPGINKKVNKTIFF